MKLSIPPYNNKGNNSSVDVTDSRSIDNDETVFLTPNCTLLPPDLSGEEFSTPLNETPTKLQMSPMGDNNDDSGLDENFHTPRVSKIKSLDNITLLDQQFKRASLEMLRKNSPEKFAPLNNNHGKIHSVGDLFHHMKNEEGKSVDKPASDVRQKLVAGGTQNKIIGKFLKNKVGHTKFLGNDSDLPTPKIMVQGKLHFPITRMKSMGTIPDVVSERVRYDPFLTPTIIRKHFSGISITSEYVLSNSPKIYDDDEESSSEPDECHDQCCHMIGSLPNGSELDDIFRKPFERGYRRSYVNGKHHNARNRLNTISSTPMRQSDGLMYCIDGRLKSSNTMSAIEMTNITSSSTTIAGKTVDTLSNNCILRNPSSGSLAISETGSLDRMKSTAEKRKKGAHDDGTPTVSGRVEETRVNPDSLIDEILKDTKLDQLEESAETTGLQLYIARDGTASLGNHEVKQRVSAGVFKQVVMETPR